MDHVILTLTQLVISRASRTQFTSRVTVVRKKTGKESKSKSLWRYTLFDRQFRFLGLRIFKLQWGCVQRQERFHFTPVFACRYDSLQDEVYNVVTAKINEEVAIIRRGNELSQSGTYKLCTMVQNCPRSPFCCVD